MLPFDVKPDNELRTQTGDTPPQRNYRNGSETLMNANLKSEVRVAETPLKKERNFPQLDLDLSDTSALSTNQPVLVIQSPKTPTLSRKLKAVSLDSDPPKQTDNLEISRDVFSMPNTPKRQIRAKYSCDFDDGSQKLGIIPGLGTNLKRFGSNTSISGSQTLKTLPEIMTLQDFSDNRTEPVRIKAKGLLERRGSNASLTIDLGSSSNLCESKAPPVLRLNVAKSVSNLNLVSFGSGEKCPCIKKCELQSFGSMDKKLVGSRDLDRRKSQEKCGNCTIYESEPSKSNSCKVKCQTFNKKCACLCNYKSRRKSLSNENLYVPPCNFCQAGEQKECASSNAKGNRRACYPRQPDLEASQLLSEDFKLHLQNIQYLQTAGSVLSIADLKASCETHRVPKLHQEFWEVPLNLQEKCIVSGSQNRNRYRGVLPNEHSRVHLPAPQSYIHANHIKGPDYTEASYIATQGPMAHTCEDFWEMIWTTKSNCIVMLTGLIEKGRSKCELYFPLGRRNNKERSYFVVKTMKARDKFSFDSGRNSHSYEEETVEFEELDLVQFGKFRIKYLWEQSLGECAIRCLDLEHSGETENRIVYHYWFPNWQDHKMANPEEVLKMALHVLDLMDKSNNAKLNYDNNVTGESISIKKPSEKSKPLENGEVRKARIPVVVHCSAGIGRTGCFLAILNGIQQLRSNFNVDVLAILCSLRLHRGGMVQTAEQYELIHRVLSLYTDSM